MERHQRPHVDVRGKASIATLDVVTGELLAGALPASGLRAVRALLARHQSLALEAFHRTLQHDFPGTLDQQLEGDEADE